MTPVADDEDILARDEVVREENAIEIVALVDERLALLRAARPELALDAASDALQRSGGDHSLGRAADPVQQVDAGLRPGGGDRRGDVAVADQVDARACLAKLPDQLVVAFALEHDDTDVGRPAAFRLRDGLNVLGRRGVDVDHADGVCSRGDLLHVDGCAGVEHRAALGDGDHRDRVRLSERRQARALERVDGHVDLGPGAGADRLAVVEHRRFVLLPLADDDDAAHDDRVEHRAHRVDRRLVGGDLVTAPDPAAGAHRRGLGDAHELERQVPVRRGRHRGLILERTRLVRGTWFAGLANQVASCFTCDRVPRRRPGRGSGRPLAARRGRDRAGTLAPGRRARGTPGRSGDSRRRA